MSEKLYVYDKRDWVIIVSVNDLVWCASELVMNVRDVDHVYREVTIQREANDHF
jgi:hypothetical protein